MPTAPNVGAAIVAVAAAQEGKEYVFGAAGPNEFDCSGLTAYSFAGAGATPVLIHQTNAQYAQFKTANSLYPYEQAQPGDVVFYQDAITFDIYHCAVYAGDGNQIAAPQTGDVVKLQ